MTSGYNVLLLEDSVVGGQVLAQLLELVGAIDVQHVRSNVDAEDELEHSNYDVCVFDINIGRGDCLSAYQKALSLKIPVVLTSGSTPDDRFDLDNAIVTYLSKPVRIEPLRDAIQQVGVVR